MKYNQEERTTYLSAADLAPKKEEQKRAVELIAEFVKAESIKPR